MLNELAGNESRDGDVHRKSSLVGGGSLVALRVSFTVLRLRNPHCAIRWFLTVSVGAFSSQNRPFADRSGVDELLQKMGRE